MPYFTNRGIVALPASQTTVYGPYTLDTGDPNWRNVTLIQNFAAANLGAATGTQARFTLKFTVLSLITPGTVVCYFGKQGTNPEDFTGTQVHVLFNGADITADGSTLDYVSDWITLGEAYDETSNYVFAASFNGSAGAATLAYKTDGPTGDINYFIDPAVDPSITDKTISGGNHSNVAELVSTIEIR